ncbi:unnamed protein product [Adineta steineri]|uniref:JmjC domain-containing protein n=1 Tax=Adineta steineri TaxID=433720 RepID=A0A819TTJ6_9BILA|nr:unnamed protein product [Adineta steineri]
MSSISTEVPTLQINADELQNIIGFIYKNERILKEFGAIKIQLHKDCKLALKKRRKNMILNRKREQIVKLCEDEPLYSVQKVDHIDELIEEKTFIIDECSFWFSLSCCKNGQRPVNISELSNKSFFSRKMSRLYFDIHRLLAQSLLKLGGTKLTRQYHPCLKRAHKSGSIFPLTRAQQHLFSINYHHEGGAHHWYVIPTSQREILERIIHRHDSTICIDHGKLFIDPLVLNKNRVRYHQIIQRPNEFVVLAANTLAQSFTDDPSWSESINFALPSWIEESHTYISNPLCQCNIHQDSLQDIIDNPLFRHERIQQYITMHLNTIDDNNSIENNDKQIVTISTENSVEIYSSNDEIMPSTNMNIHESMETIISSNSSIISNIDNCFSQQDKNKSDENNTQIQDEILEEGIFQDALEWSSTNRALIESIVCENWLERDIRTSHLYQSNTTCTNIDQNGLVNDEHEER